MKKLFIAVLSVLLCGTIFTSFSPSLDGRAVVAPEGTMPKGVFAKTVGYLPGDSISVTSLSTKNTVDILVIGSIDSSEGVAILLSPEAAELLGLSKDANNVVKITKRSGQLDEAVAGTAVIGGEVQSDEEAVPVEEKNAASVEEEKSFEAAENSGDAENSVEEIFAEPSESAEVETENAAEPEKSEESENQPEYESIVSEPDELSDENPVEAERAENEPLPEVIDESESEPETSSAADEAVPEPVEIEEPLSEENIPSGSAEENPVDAEKIEAEDAPEIQENVENPAVPVEECAENNEPDEKSEPVESDDLGENAEKIPDVEKIEATEEPLVEEAEPENESMPLENDDVVSEAPFEEEAVEPDELSESHAEKSEPVGTEENLPAENAAEAAPEPVESENLEPESAEPQPLSEGEGENAGDEDESYEPIILVPAESNPPENNVSSENISSGAVKTEAAEKTSENAGVVIENKAESVSAEKAAEPKTAGSQLEKYKVGSLKELESGKYYVQIAVLADESNLKATVSKFAEQYPVALVPLSSGKAMQVLIGPLNMDEYGAVLNRFKKSGYKDAFLRKIK